MDIIWPKARHVLSVTSRDVLEALQQPLNGIITAVRHCLGRMSAGTRCRYFERGIVLTGGGALLRNF